MSTSQGVNVLRWSALAFGVFYGAYHQSGITAKVKQEELDREYNHKLSLIQKAKAEWAKKNAPPSQSTGAITDPEDPKFDLEAFLQAKATESP